MKQPQPLALVFYEKLLPGTQLVNRLQDFGYRVQTVNDSVALLSAAIADKPLLVLVDLNTTKTKISEAIAELRRDPATNHLPVIAFAEDKNAAMQKSATNAGATLVVSNSAIVTHLEQFLEQALQLD